MTDRAERSGDPDRILFAYGFLGIILVNGAQFERARRLLQHVVEHYETERHFRFVYIAGHDVKVMAHSWLAWLCGYTGHYDQAHLHWRRAVEHATRIAHPLSLSFAHGMGTLALALLGDCEQAMQSSRDCATLCESQGIPYWMGWSLAGEAVAHYYAGDYGRSAQCMLQADTHLRATGSSNGHGFTLGWMAVALAHAGRFDEARRVADEGRALAVAAQEAVFIPPPAYGRGMVELLDPNGDTGLAEQWLATALAEARSQGDRMMALRAAMALARIWQPAGKSVQARALIGSIRAEFTEGLHMKDLMQASALLDELEAGA